MKKRIVSVMMIIILLAGILSFNALAAGSLSNFTKVNTYNGQFTDVPDLQWYAGEVQLVYEYGLINGITDTTFEPGSYLKLSEAIKLAAVLHSIYNTGTSTFVNGDPWYQNYVDYALENGIISSGYANYDTYATRADFALIFANALPEEALTPINDIDINVIPDVNVSYSYGPAVYLLYRAGVLTGSGENHAYKPNDKIRRSEVAAIAARMANSSYRKSFSMALEELASTEIAAQCSPAVFYIEVYDASGEPFASGSGFFIESSGLAVTNYHVIEGAASAVIMTTDNAVYDVAGVYDYSEEYDLALLQIDGSGFPFLPVGDSDTVVSGAQIYAIGNPQGLVNTISQGIVSNAARVFSDSIVSYIQIDAAISSGSSGGALVNTLGQVIGVTTATFTAGQNLNLAVPINLMQELGKTSYTPLSSIDSHTGDYVVNASSSNVTVQVSGKKMVTINDPSGDPDFSVYYEIADESVVACSWGDWEDNYYCPIYIIGLTEGSTTVTVYLTDEWGNDLAETTITVTVSENTTAYYADYSTTPDFGDYTDTPLYYASYYPYGDSMDYYYRLDDIEMNIDDFMDGYGELLESNGFYLDDSFIDDYGNPVMAYEHADSGLYIMYGISDCDDFTCLLIYIIP